MMRKRGQAVLEYTIILAIIIAVVVAVGRTLFQPALEGALTNASERIEIEAEGLLP